MLEIENATFDLQCSDCWRVGLVWPDLTFWSTNGCSGRIKMFADLRNSLSMARGIPSKTLSKRYRLNCWVSRKWNSWFAKLQFLGVISIHRIGLVSRLSLADVFSVKDSVWVFCRNLLLFGAIMYICSLHHKTFTCLIENLLKGVLKIQRVSVSESEVPNSLLVKNLKLCCGIKIISKWNFWSA